MSGAAAVPRGPIRSGDTVLVTGAAGGLGRHVVDALLAAGHPVVALDTDATEDRRGDEVRYLIGDVTDAAAVRQAVAGCAGVVHCAAVPHPDEDRAERVMTVNVVGAFAVLRAAAAAGAARAVLCSSVSALGMAWSPVPVSPRYAPVDEEHPLEPADHYGLSKQLVEQTAAMVSRRDGIGTACLRFPWVGYPDRLAGQLEAVRADPGERTARRDLWSYVLPEDVAGAALAALNCRDLGAEVFNVVAPDTVSDVATEDLIREFHPATRLDRALPGSTPAWTVDRLRDRLGYVPSRTWRPADPLSPVQPTTPGNREESVPDADHRRPGHRHQPRQELRDPADRDVGRRTRGR